jgi:hypothetical protein
MSNFDEDIFKFLKVTAGSSVIASEAKQSIQLRKKEEWIASSRSLSSGAHSRDPLAPRNDGRYFLA